MLRSFEQMAAFTGIAWSYDLTGPGTAEHMNGAEVSSGFFATLGIKTGSWDGFLFPAEDHPRRAGRFAMMSDRLWKGSIRIEPPRQSARR